MNSRTDAGVQAKYLGYQVEKRMQGRIRHGENVISVRPRQSRIRLNGLPKDRIGVSE